MFKLYELFIYTCIAHVHFTFNALCTWLPINSGGGTGQADQAMA